MNRIGLVATRDALRHELERLDAIAVKCETCSFWTAGGVTCEKFQAVPPIEVRRVGCAEWDYDWVPF